jgi:hypothetical protein
MTDWDEFLRGFDQAPEQELEREPDASDILVQLDALHDERVERGDARWFPRGPDPQGLEQLVRERWARRHRSE